MKDLYTFDPTVDDALATYEEVRQAYARFFADLKLPVLVAKASSGDMGGDLSHEYHLATSFGEDNVVSCNSCDYTINDELAETQLPTDPSEIPGEVARQQLSLWKGITKDRKKIVQVWYLDSAKTDGTASSSETQVNIHAIKALVPDLDTSIQDVGPLISHLEKTPSHLFDPDYPVAENLVDVRLANHIKAISGRDDSGVSSDELDHWTAAFHALSVSDRPSRPLPHGDGNYPNLLKINNGDSCPKCEHGSLKVEKAIELGHTFHLGTRYSQPLEATVQLPSGGNPVPLQMGCHGIGVSRLIGVVANHLADDKGLNWPRKIAPYEVVVIAKNDAQEDAEAIFDLIAKDGDIDAVLDDRWAARFPWRMKDAELIGYPVVVILGKKWGEERLAEVQCRRLGVKELVGAEEVAGFVSKLLKTV
jgi:prolyl-tRNA synthetase